MIFRFIAALAFGWVFSAGLKAAGAEASAKNVRVAAVPAWAKLTNETGPATPPTSPGGMEYFLVDQQDHLASAASFNHITYRITADSGLQAGSQVSVEFDPDYQSLDWHFVKVRRDGKTVDRLDLKAVRIIQQEKELERHLYNGQLTALVLLEDIRVGDVVDFAYTRRGANPVFGNRYLESFSAGYTVPVSHLRMRVLAPPGRTLFTRLHGQHGLTAGAVTTAAGTDYLWEGRDLPAVQVDADAPAWYTAFPFGEISEFPDWPSVVKWALPLYDVKTVLTPAVREKAHQLADTANDPEGKILAVLDFVQREIRYLGMELGPGSHRPSPPSEVLVRRFGDCKDKARLLCALLATLGFEAHPALVHSQRRERLKTLLPSPYDFDHVIVQLTLNGTRYWLDGTRSNQRGALRLRSAINYSPALVIAPTTVDLTPMTDDPVGREKIRTSELFNVSRVGEPATLQVDTSYQGGSAEGMRAYRAHSSSEDIARNFLNYYSRAFPSIQAQGPPRWEDNPDGSIAFHASYLVPDLWKKNPDSGRMEASFLPLLVFSQLARPNAPQRTAPLAVDYPVDRSQTTIVRLPRPWPIKNSMTTKSTPIFSYHSQIFPKGNDVVMTYDWMTLDDNVPVEKVAAYAADLTELREISGYVLIDVPRAVPGEKKAGERPVVREEFSLNWTMVLLGLTVTLILFLAAWRIYWWIPQWPPPLPDERFDGRFGGWLILVGFGVILRPLFVLGTMVKDGNGYFDQRVWVALTIPGNPAYHPAMAPALAFELVTNLLLLVTSLLTVVLFFQKRRQFPLVMICLLAGSAVLLTTNSYWLFTLRGSGGLTPADYRPMMQGFGAMCIWVPYFLISKRVKSTFVV